MNVTLGKNEEPASGNRQPDAAAGEDSPQLARARDGQRTPNPLTLPDTERVGESWRGFLDGLAETRDRVWSGEIWDTQPPSPRELIDRGKDSPWADSEGGALRYAAWAGHWFALAWSVIWYSVAIVGQRFGRAVTVICLIALIKYLIST